MNSPQSQPEDRGCLKDALECVRADRVHLIIGDYNILGMDGLQLLETVRGGAVLALGVGLKAA